MKPQRILGIIKLGITLAIFAAAACIMLAFVYAGTKKVIAERQQTELEAALRELFPQADNFLQITEIKSIDLSVTFGNEYAALKDDNIIGVAAEISRAGYSGLIKMLAGISAEGFVTGVRVIEHSETPGLGANAASPSYFVDKARGITFCGQFAGKSIWDPFEVNNDVVVITASTVTSRAIALAVKAAALSVTHWLNGEEVDVISGASAGGIE